MSPEVLMALAAAKGLPMPNEEGVRVDAIGDLLRREKRLRDMMRRLERRGDVEAVRATQALLSSKHFTHTATGKNSRTTKPLTWTHAECAQACKGLEDRYYQALRYEYALDDTSFHPVSTHLFEWALERREFEEWPKRVLNQEGELKPYLRDLVDIWMLEARAPSRFRQATPADPDLRRVLADIPETLWRRRISKIYEAIRIEYQAWLSIGASHMGRLMREDAA